MAESLISEATTAAMLLYCGLSACPSVTLMRPAKAKVVGRNKMQFDSDTACYCAFAFNAFSYSGPLSWTI